MGIGCSRTVPQVVLMSQFAHSDVFCLLPETRPPWKKFGFSMGTQSIIVLIAILLGALLPHTVIPAHDHHFVRLVDTPHPVDRVPAPEQPIKVSAQTEPKTFTPDPIKVPVVAKPQRAVERAAVAPAIQLAQKLIKLPQATPPIPREPVKTNAFSTGSSEPATMDRAPHKVQTGGFGDPNGVSGHDDSRNRPVNIARLGSFDLPTGSGHGNGTGGTHGASGVVASSGFGNGTATGNRTGRPNAPAVQQAGFGGGEPARNQVSAQRATSVTPSLIPAEILFKPTPAYTAEARKLRIEGEVLLEVVFEASGAIRVMRVVSGLGHGLDESAIQAAEQIRFKPALRDGQPSDSTGILHIVFQLA